MIRFLATSLCSLSLLLPALASAQQPDLVGTIVAPPTAAPGQMGSFTVQVRNTGEAAAGSFEIEVWLSEDPILDVGQGGDHKIFSRRITLDGAPCNPQDQSIPPGCVWPPFPPPVPGNPTPSPEPIQMKIPPQPGFEEGYVILRIDPLNEVEESTEANEFPSFSTVQLIMADLGFSDFDIDIFVPDFGCGAENPKHCCYFGERIEVEYEICNTGGGEAWAFAHNLYLSPNNKIDGAVLVASSPRSCRTPETMDCGGEGICVAGICHMFCETDDECGPGERCAPDATQNYTVGKTCQNYLAVGECQTVRHEVVLPTGDINDQPLAERSYNVFAEIAASESFPDGDYFNNYNDPQPVEDRLFCRYPRPDIDAIELLAPPRVAAGETATVVRKLRNLGIRPGTASYRYVLSENDFPSVDDIVLPVEATGKDGIVTVEANSESQGADLVRIPSFVRPKEYFLGIVIDPENQLDELEKSNNRFVGQQKVVVEPPSLAVVTRTLPRAVVGNFMSVQLVAVGGVAAYEWSADRLPTGFVLDPDGTLSGTPKEAGQYDFNVTVRSGNLTAIEPLVLQVFEPMGTLTITTTSLPTARLDKPYAARIAAQGGWGAYKCSYTGIPVGLVPNEDCTIGGRIQTMPSTTTPLTVTVTDELGATASRDYVIRVIDGPTLIIETERLEQAMAGRVYGERGEQCIAASGGDRAYTWSVESNPDRKPPRGTTLTERTNTSTGRVEFCLGGTPTECGDFLIPVRVEDGAGQSAVADVALNVLCSEIDLVTESFEAVRRGDSIDLQLEADPAENVRFRILAGRLPDGLELDENGRLSGTVATDAAVGTYSFLIGLENDVGGESRHARSIEVLPTLADLTPIPDKVEEIGCSSTGSGPAGALPLLVVLLGLVAVGLRRRVAATVRIGAVVAVIGLAGVAQAQSDLQDGYFVTAPFEQPYEELVGATEADPQYNHVDWSSDTHTFGIELPSDFTFRFFGKNYPFLGVNGNGAAIPWETAKPTGAAFYPPTSNDSTFPESSTPNGIIAVWWEDFARGALSPHPGGISWTIEGNAPHRVLKVQWKNLTPYDCTDGSSTLSYPCGDVRSYSFQLWIAESDGTHDSALLFSYDTPIGPDGTPWGGLVSAYEGTVAATRPSASVGIESVDQTMGATVLACTPNCHFDVDFPDQQAILITQTPDVRVKTMVASDTVIWAGIPVAVEAHFDSVGYGGTGPFVVDFVLSRDPWVDGTDVVLGTSAPIAQLMPGQAASVAMDLQVPLDTPPGTYYFVARADPAGAIGESFVANNVRAFGPVTIGAPTPDLSIEAVSAPTTLQVGEVATVEWIVRNGGNAPVVNVPYGIYLDDNGSLTAADLRIGGGVLTIDMLATEVVTTEVVVPEDVHAGRFHLGVIVDPDSTLGEIDEFNNARLADEPVDLVAGALRVATTRLPAAAIGSSYCAPLVALGGNGAYTWGVAEGSALPEGFALDRQSARNTRICGVPVRVGSWAFDLEVVSGDERATGTILLEVTEAAAPLAVVSGDVPAATFNQPYQAHLAAVGGRAPYAWTLVAGALPKGLGFSSDGTIAGAAKVAGTFDFRVRVTDAGGEAAEMDVSLTVLAPTQVSCVTTSIGNAALGEALSFQLEAAGGTQPYTWTAIEARRLATANDSGATIPGGSPPGLALARDGAVTGTPTVAGSYIWTVEVRDNASSQNCLVLLDVAYEQGLTITTQRLADADIGVPYEVELRATGGEGFLVWSVGAGSELPPGLELDPEGTLSGVLDASLLEGAERRTFDFEVEVRDAANRRGSAALSLTLRMPVEAPPSVEPGPPTEKGGCQAAAGAPGLLGVAMALAFLARRRRS